MARPPEEKNPPGKLAHISFNIAKLALRRLFVKHF